MLYAIAVLNAAKYVGLFGAGLQLGASGTLHTCAAPWLFAVLALTDCVCDSPLTRGVAHVSLPIHPFPGCRVSGKGGGSIHQPPVGVK